MLILMLRTEKYTDSSEKYILKKINNNRNWYQYVMQVTTAVVTS